MKFYFGIYCINKLLLLLFMMGKNINENREMDERSEEDSEDKRK